MANGRKGRGQRRKQRRKLEKMLIASDPELSIAEELPPAQQDEFIEQSNLLPKMDDAEIRDVVTLIEDRYRSAESQTHLMSEQVDKAERQTDGRWPGQEPYSELEEGDDRMFLGKTQEQVTQLQAHLLDLVARLDPLVRVVPEPKGYHPLDAEYQSAYLKESLLDYMMRKSEFKKNILPRWILNFLKHPSAFLQVTYKHDDLEPDIGFEIVDRGELFIDPQLRTGDVKDAAWVIRETFVTKREVEQMVKDGHWTLDEGLTSDKQSQSFSGIPDADVWERILGQTQTDIANAAEQDEPIVCLHYWQAHQGEQPHAYGVMLGGYDGTLVRWGANPYPHKGVPFAGKSYLPDVYKVDGKSLVSQYRSIQELINTLLNLRIENLSEGVRARYFVSEALFGTDTADDWKNNQKFVRLDRDLSERLAREGRGIQDFMFRAPSEDSTQHLHKDMEIFAGVGNDLIGTNDRFRGTAQGGAATLGEVQEQLTSALKTFRPVFSQVMGLVEDVSKIILTYLDDETFFGPFRLVSFAGESRYSKLIKGLEESPDGGVKARLIAFDEMLGDVSVDALSTAEQVAQNSLKMSMFTGIMDAMRHHPKQMEEAAEKINFGAVMESWFRTAGADMTAIMYTPEQQQQRQQAQQQAQQQAMQQQMQMMQAQEGMKAQGKMQEMQAASQLRTGEKQQAIMAQGQVDSQLGSMKLSGDFQVDMEKMRAQHQADMERMMFEYQLEASNPNVKVGHDQNNIN